MKVSTKAGDCGFTNLGGKNFSKDDPLIEALGNLDELNAALGLAKLHVHCDKYKHFLEEMQRSILSISSLLISDDECIKSPSVEAIEQVIMFIEENYSTPAQFICPGNSDRECFLHLARTVARRAERSVVSLAKENVIALKVIPFINRLSDAIWLIASIQ